MHYKAILFDADGTLFDYDKAEAFALAKSLSDFNVSYKQKLHLSLYQKINESLWREFEQGQVSQNDLKFLRFQRFFEALNLTIDPEAFSRTYLGELARGAFLIPGAEKLMAVLHTRGLRLALVTNGLLEVQAGRVRRSPLHKYFHCMVVSEEVGEAKPHPRIFAAALSRLGHHDKKTTLMVGDNPVADIKGAGDFGLATCWYNPEGLTVQNLDCTYAINRLADLETILFPGGFCEKKGTGG